MIPNGAYNGQKLIKLVKRNIAAKISATIPSVPGIVPVKYNIAITTANTTRIARSVLPIFFFMTTNCLSSFKVTDYALVFCNLNHTND